MLNQRPKHFYGLEEKKNSRTLTRTCLRNFYYLIHAAEMQFLNISFQAAKTIYILDINLTVIYSYKSRETARSLCWIETECTCALNVYLPVVQTKCPGMHLPVALLCIVKVPHPVPKIRHSLLWTVISLTTYTR